MFGTPGAVASPLFVEVITAAVTIAATITEQITSAAVVNINVFFRFTRRFGNIILANSSEIPNLESHFTSLR